MRNMILHIFSGLLALTIAAPLAAETDVGSTIESRVLLGFKVDDSAISSMLPDGWVSVTLPDGPAGGANLIVAFIDRHLILDSDGKPANPASGPTVALLAYARKDGVAGVRGFVTRVYEEPPLVDPYGTSVPADIDRIAGYTDAGQGNRRQTERWIVRPEGGGEIAFELDHKVGGFLWAPGGESQPYSAINPEFSRIYRYDQLVTFAMNTAMGRALDGTVSVVISDPDLAGLFGGDAEPVAILSIPTYLRRITLP